MKPATGKRIFIQEVVLRDGFQMEPIFIPTDVKVELIDRLSRSGVAKIEATSFTSPRAIPALADAEAVMHRITRVPGVVYAALVPNARGCERALECGTDEVNVVMSASQTHNQANLRMSCEDSLRQFTAIAEMAREAGTAVNASLATAFGCPFEGKISTSRVMELLDRIADAGIGNVALCDTTGMANPAQVADLCSQVRQRYPQLGLTAHFHNTRGMGLANVLGALEAGIERFDASLGGLGGCPYAPGASGNICTEDLVHMLQSMGYHTGVDLDALLALARWLPEIVGHEVPGQVLAAGPSSRRYAAPGACSA